MGRLTMKRLSLRTIFNLAMFTILLVCSAVFVGYSYESQQRQMVDTLVEQARTFAREMDAVWTFMDRSQHYINYESDGSYEFKGLHCAVVGKGVGALFSYQNDYQIRYTNYDPRNVQDYPDAFEIEALDALAAGEGAGGEYYAIADYEGERRFRYVKALEVDESCLSCHGEPAGETDITGFEKEGWQLGDMGGAISIVIPLDGQEEATAANLRSEVALFFVLAVAIFVVVVVFTNRFIFKPLKGLEHAFGRAREGDLSAALEVSVNSREIDNLLSHFNRMAAELCDVYEHLEDQVEERTEELSRANEVLKRQGDELQALNAQLAKEVQFKTNLLSIVNHELRTPLTAIITLAQIAKEGEVQGGSTTAEMMQGIEDSGQELLEMINNMLDVARSDAGAIGVLKEPMDLGDVVLATRATMLPLANKYNVALETALDPDVPLVEGDYEKLQRIMNNLVGNAIKFTPDGGCVRVHVYCEKECGDVLLAVSDTGIGISEEDQKRIFERFFQVDNTSTRKYNGSGLGLTITKEYSELQGFCLTVESTVGAGSVFTVRIPKELTME